MGPHVTERLSAYMDGELSLDERAAVDAHLRACPACSTHLEELRAVEGAARALPLDVPEGYFEAFPGRVRRRLERAHAPRRRYAPAWTLAAAAALVLAVLTPRLMREPREQASPAVPAVPAQPEPAAPPAGTLAGSGPAAQPPPAAAKTDSVVAVGGRLEERARPQTTPAPAAATAPTREYAGNAASAPPEGYAASPADIDQVQGAPAESAPRAKRVEAESGVAARAEESKARRDETALGALQDRAAPPSASETRYHGLLRRTASSAAESRALRDAWRAFLRDEPSGPRADEAQVRVIEAGAAAWRQGRNEKDRAEAEREGREYLARADALQPDRVRAALQTLSR